MVPLVILPMVPLATTESGTVSAANGTTGSTTGISIIERHWSRKQDGDTALKTITFFTMYSVVNMVLGNIWPIKYENRKTLKLFDFKFMISGR